MQSRLFSLITLLAFTSVCGVARAGAEDYFELTPEQLLNARVLSVSKKPEKLSEAPAAVYVITPEDISRSGMTSIPDLLRMVPGVTVARQSADSWAISIRGFNNTTANKLLVMIDGRTVYNPFFAGTFWEVQDMPLSDILRIEVIRGPGGTMWGSNAVNGVINIITKTARDTQGNRVNLIAGNYERGMVSARHGGKISDNIYYRVYAKAEDHDDFEKLDASPRPAHDEWQNYRTGFRLDSGDANSADYVTFHGDAYRVNAENYNTSYSFVAPFSTVSGETVKNTGFNLMQMWRHNYDSGASHRLQYYIDYTDRQQILFKDRRLTFDIDGTYNFQRHGRHEFSLGGNFRHMGDHIGGSNELDFDPGHLQSSLLGLYAQDKIMLMPEEWFLTLGAKMEHNDYTGWEFQPNARLEWLIDERQSSWAAVSRAVRMPSRIERDMNIANLIVGPGVLDPALPAEVTLAHNKDFDAEDLIAYEMGYRNQITPNLALDTAIFANDYKHLQSAVLDTPFLVPAGADPAHMVFPVRYTNDMSGEVYGLEIAASWKVRDDWKLSAGYTYLQMYLHAPLLNGNTQEQGEGRSPENQFNLRSFWTINDNWTFDTMLFYVDELENFDIDSYVRVDANLGWKIKQGLQFNLVGQNLLEDEHREFGAATNVNAMQVPRSVFGKLTWDF
jgi:iron complex outermembrane recepter protein